MTALPASRRTGPRHAPSSHRALWKEPLVDSLLRGRYREQLPGYFIPQGTRSDPVGNVCADIDYASRQSMPFTTTAGEWPYYERSLQKFVRRLPAQATVFDLGCGDGRVTLKLLDTTDCSIVSADIDAANVARLAQRVKNEDHGRWLGFVGDAREIPFQDGSFDGCCAMGLLHLLRDDAPCVIHKIHKVLKPGGTLIDSEALFESALLYAVARRDTDEFLKVFSDHTKTSNYDDPHAGRIGVLTADEIQHLLEDHGFHRLEQYPVPVLPSLIYGAWFQEDDIPEATKHSIREALTGLQSVDGYAARVLISISRKNGTL